MLFRSDSTKFGRRSPNVVCDIESVNTIITDDKLDDKYYDALIEKGIKVIKVKPLDK